MFADVGSDNLEQEVADSIKSKEQLADLKQKFGVTRYDSHNQITHRPLLMMYCIACRAKMRSMESSVLKPSGYGAARRKGRRAGNASRAQRDTGKDARSSSSSSRSKGSDKARY